MISKELLETVLNINIRYMSEKYDGNLIPYETDKWKTINIYELANKCENWAYEQYGKAIISGIDIENKNVKKFKAKIKQFGFEDYKYFYGNTEPEVIFKAVQFILENQDKNVNDNYFESK